MNLNLYTDEFRDFKYLKSSNDSIIFYKDTFITLNKVRPIDRIDDETFTWDCRLEFVEQLMDLADEVVYLVEAGQISIRHNSDTPYSDYEESRIYEIVKPMLIAGNAFGAYGRILTLDDIPAIENPILNNDFYLREANGRIPQLSDTDNIPPKQVFRLGEIPLIPQDWITYSAMFYNKEQARCYCSALTTYLRKNNDAISAITRMF